MVRTSVAGLRTGWVSLVGRRKESLRQCRNISSSAKVDDVLPVKLLRWKVWIETTACSTIFCALRSHSTWQVLDWHMRLRQS